MTKNPGLQWMRAVAALLVVADHSVYTLIEKAGADPASAVAAASWGGVGVEIFFVISGFVMIVSSTRRFGPAASAEFMRRRLIRIVPLFWATTLVYALKTWQVGDPISVAAVVRSLLFVPYLNSHGGIQPVLGLGWTLNYEMVFYAIFALGLAWSLRATLWLAALTLLAATGFGLALSMPTAPVDAVDPAVLAYFYTRPIVLFFLIGIGLALVVGRLQGRAGRWTIGFTTAMTATVLWIALPLAFGGLPLTARLLWVPAALLAISLARVESTTDRRLASIATLLGDASYSIYLTHPFVIGPLGRAWGRVGMGTGTVLASPVVFTAVAFVVCCGVGILCFRYIETPVQRWLSAKTRDPASVATQPA